MWFGFVYLAAGIFCFSQGLTSEGLRCPPAWLSTISRGIVSQYLLTAVKSGEV